uniref:Uncharacterized protein n=1 Tax=Anopheles funestus TaxID=62324 RepID=A0A182RTB8_ANOFN
MINSMMLMWAVALCGLITLGKAASSLPGSSSGISSSSSSSSGNSGSSSSSNSFPVFGTKRYARSNLLPSSEYGGQGLSLPVYHLPNARYYDAQVPAQYFPYAPYQPPSSNDYYDDAGYYGDTGKSYYYLPQPQHRRYQRNNERYTSYGLPTYRGEYKPTPYYYAHGPSYSYSDDHESSNPLDDLHEEMLQEDERERARDYYPVGQEQWYESPSRQDSAFLRNLILYNSQLQNFGRGRQLPPMDVSNEEDFEEYDDTEPDYEYDVPIADTRPSYGNFFGNGYRTESLPNYGPTGAGASPSRNTFSKLNSFRNSMAKNQIDEDDEEVAELKSLIHQQKNSQRLPPMLMDKMAPFVLKQQQYPAAPKPPQHQTNQQPQQVHQRQSKQQYQQLQPQQQTQQRQKELQQQQQQQLLLQQQQQQQLEAQQQLQKEQKQQQLLRTLSSDYQPTYETDNWPKDSPSYNAYDYDADEYDDSWSHWDRKRNVQPKKATFSTTTTKTTTQTTAKPPKKVTPSTTAVPVPVKPATPSTKPGNGQKEVVLPRPTNPRNLFAANLIQAVDETRMQLGSPKVADGSKQKEPKSSKIYDALRAMINMKHDLEDADLRQQLEDQKQLAHIHKRFVSNEESLVQQLDGLKRSA